jgi:2-hydroxychromene-2-carboxylate isomerase
MTEVAFWYDFSSPFSYLGATQIERVAAEAGARVRWRPFLLGALFKKIGTADVPMATFPEPKRRYFARDLNDWAEFWSVPFSWPSRFPMRTVAALRVALAAGDARVAAVTRALYRAYWVEDRDLADEAVLREVAATAGMPGADIQRALAPDPAIKQALVANTDEAVATGLCGAPSFVVRGHVFWGQDRLDLVAKTLAGWNPPTL